jgi:hypothetical protein
MGEERKDEKVKEGSKSRKLAVPQDNRGLLCPLGIDLALTKNRCLFFNLSRLLIFIVVALCYAITVKNTEKDYVFLSLITNCGVEDS